jgi:two-component system sensor histidine kinase KdpD
MVSHELRSLAAIKGSASLALQSPIPLEAEQARELFRAIDNQVDELADLVANLLDITRIEAGTLSVRPEPWTCAGSLGKPGPGSPGRRDAGGPGAPARRCPCRKSGRTPNRPGAHQPPQQRGQFSPPDAPISVSVEHDDHFVTVRVADQGPGVPGEKLPQLFKKFAQVQTEDHRAQPGTSLRSRHLQGHRGGTVDASGPIVPVGERAPPSPSRCHWPPAETIRRRRLRAPKRTGRAKRRDAAKLRILAVDDDPRISSTCDEPW